VTTQPTTKESNMEPDESKALSAITEWLIDHDVHGWFIPVESHVELTPWSPGKVLVEMTLIREVSNEDAQRLLEAASETMTATTLRATS